MLCASSVVPPLSKREKKKEEEKKKESSERIWNQAEGALPPTPQESADLVPSYARKAAALAGKERRRQGARPAVKRLAPPSTQSLVAASAMPEYLRCAGLRASVWMADLMMSSG